MFGPLLIFDKSFLQMLNAEEVSELTFLFHPVATPLLIREIIADLKKDTSSSNCLPTDVVRALARKMSEAHGVMPADFRKLTIANLCGGDVPMFGQVPVDTTAPNVRVSGDGKMMLYDSVPEQHMWKRWAAGDFSTEEQEVAAAWRRGLEKVDLRAVGDGWKDFARERFRTASNMPDLIGQVEVLLSDPKPDTQLELLGFILAFVQAPEDVKTLAYKLQLEQRYTRIRDFAPYAASVLKLYLSFIGGLARGFVGPRPSHYVDLQYLFYAPFSMVFVSGDKFQRELWPATAVVNTFVWGQDLKTDLTRRVALRKEMTQEQLKAYSEKYSFYPIEIEDSITNDLWKRYMRPPTDVVAPRRPAETIDDLEPEVRSAIKGAIREFDERDV
jgi:hypothetical protein